MGAHFAISSLFFGFPGPQHLYCYEADLKNSTCSKAGRPNWSLGRACTCRALRATPPSSTFAVLHLGDLTVCLPESRRFQGDESYQQT